jgi:chaperonin GroEL
VNVHQHVKLARAALRDGVVPGGGAALLNCVPAVTRVQACHDEAIGANAVARALAEPMRVILTNAGVDAEPILRQAQTVGEAFDVIERRWMDAQGSMLMDPVTVLVTALEASVSTAAAVVTGEVLMRRKRPPISVDP